MAKIIRVTKFRSAKCPANFRSVKLACPMNLAAKFVAKTIGSTKFHRGCELAFVSGAEPLDLPALGN